MEALRYDSLGDALQIFPKFRVDLLKFGPEGLIDKALRDLNHGRCVALAGNTDRVSDRNGATGPQRPCETNMSTKVNLYSIGGSLGRSSLSRINMRCRARSAESRSPEVVAPANRASIFMSFAMRMDSFIP